ncbi:AAA family ATPase [Streptomyces purpurascens]|uniref:AAA family ATPase n=1 Tax=Streptomyces purpurascens TaxID=1924 RepID=UPI003C2C0F1C
MVALAVVTNYVTTSLPGWAEDPRLVWGVFGGLAVIALVLQLWGRRLDTDQSGASGGRPVAVSRIVSDAAESLRPPSIDRPVRGREATISDLQRLLRRSRVANRIAVVTGTGGMGKTTVAAAMAKKAQEKGTPVFWIPALNASELAEHMVRVAVACGLQEEALESARAGRVSLADAVWEQLAKTKRWLIVLRASGSAAGWGLRELVPESAFRWVAKPLTPWTAIPPSRHPATAKVTPGAGTLKSVRCSVTPKGGVSIGERSRRSIPVGTNAL